MREEVAATIRPQEVEPIDHEDRFDPPHRLDRRCLGRHDPLAVFDGEAAAEAAPARTQRDMTSVGL